MSLPLIGFSMLVEAILLGKEGNYNASSLSLDRAAARTPTVAT